MMRVFNLAMAMGALLLWATSANAILITNTNNANTLSGAITGSGVTISNPTFSGATSTAAGTFTGGNASGLGFDQGIILTTGTTGCVPGPNNTPSCGPFGGTTSSLAFDFTVTSGEVFFDYVFGSEEYPEFVDAGFNDNFELLLNGTNIALIPGGGGVVSIDNVNAGDNAGFFIDNEVLPGLDLQYDGLTTVLTASASGLGAGTHTMEFLIEDIGDTVFDSGVFIKASSFSDVIGDDDDDVIGDDDDDDDDVMPPPVAVPEPSIIALFAAGLFGLGFARRGMRS